MTERLRVLRGPIACVVMVAAACELLLALGGFVYYAVVAGVANGAYAATSQSPLTWGLVVFLAAASCTWWAPPTQRARLVTLLAALELGVFALVAVVFGCVVVLVGDGALTMVGVIIEGAVVGLLAAVMAVVHQGMPPSRVVREMPSTAQPPVRPMSQSAGGPQWAPPTQSAHPPAPQYPTQWQEPRSQTDQFGNRTAHYDNDYSENSSAAGSGDWLPAAQQPPHRLEPSPNPPPVGPHLPAPGTESDQHASAGSDDDHGRSDPSAGSREP